MLNGFLYWILPLGCCIFASFIMIFSRESLGSWSFITFIMFHPVVSITVAYFFERIEDVIMVIMNKVFPNMQEWKGRFFGWTKRFFTFSIVLYFAFAIIIQFYIFQLWTMKRQEMAGKDGSVELVTDYDPDSNFNQCPDPDWTRDSDTENLINLISEWSSGLKSGVLIGAAFFLLGFHFVESLLKEEKPKTFKNFYIGETDKDSQRTNRRSCAVISFSVLGFVFIAFVFLSPLYFKALMTKKNAYDIKSEFVFSYNFFLGAVFILPI